MNIAFDIDRTVYNTDACFRDAFKKATSEYPFFGRERLGRAEELLIDDRIWFNPAYLNPVAMEILKGLSKDNSLYVCTMRNSPIYQYGELLADIGFVPKDILQCKNKAVTCFNNDIDFIIDDDMRNLESHLQYIDMNPHYTTKYILYVGEETSSAYYRQGKLNPLTVKNTYIMTEWTELPEIVNSCNTYSLS